MVIKFGLILVSVYLCFFPQKTLCKSLYVIGWHHYPLTLKDLHLDLSPVDLAHIFDVKTTSWSSSRRLMDKRSTILPWFLQTIRRMKNTHLTRHNKGHKSSSVHFPRSGAAPHLVWNKFRVTIGVSLGNQMQSCTLWLMGCLHRVHQSTTIYAHISTQEWLDQSPWYFTRWKYRPLGFV